MRSSGIVGVEVSLVKIGVGTCASGKSSEGCVLAITLFPTQVPYHNPERHGYEMLATCFISRLPKLHVRWLGTDQAHGPECFDDNPCEHRTTLAMVPGEGFCRGGSLSGCATPLSLLERLRLPEVKIRSRHLTEEILIKPKSI